MLNGFLFIRILIVFFSFTFVTSCSESEETIDYAESADMNTEDSGNEIYDESMDSESENEEEEWDPAKEGYRRAIMTVSFHVNQSGQAREKSPPGETNDPSETRIDWTVRFDASRQMNVWVNKDLSIIVPEKGSFEERLSYVTSEPYFENEKASQPAPTGQMSASMQYYYHRPNASDFVRQEGDVNVTGKIVDIEISGMNPSYYGNGYEVTFKLNYDFSGTSKQLLEDRNGKITNINDELGPRDEIKFTFYPKVFANKLNDYPIESEDIIPSVRKSRVRLMREILKGLNNEKHLILSLGTSRAGMKTIASKDALSLHYRYTGLNDLPMFNTGLMMLAAKINKNLVELKIDFELVK